MITRLVLAVVTVVVRREVSKDVEPDATHLTDPRQLALFAISRQVLRREKGRFGTKRLHELTPEDTALIEVFLDQAQAQAWPEGTIGHAERALRVLFAWRGSRTPVNEEDVERVPDEQEGRNAAGYPRGRRGARRLHRRLVPGIGTLRGEADRRVRSG